MSLKSCWNIDVIFKLVVFFIFIWLIKVDWSCLYNKIRFWLYEVEGNNCDYVLFGVFLVKYKI